jgi:hypothetical protein
MVGGVELTRPRPRLGCSAIVVEDDDDDYEE